MKHINLTPARRRAVYLVAAAVAAVLVAYGLISEDQAPVWLELVAAILGVAAPTLAVANVPKGEAE